MWIRYGVLFVRLGGPQINGELRTWVILGVNDFSAKRGRMSIVVRPEGWSEGAVMYLKGEPRSHTALQPLCLSLASTEQVLNCRKESLFRRAV